MITDLNNILKTVIYAPPPVTFEHKFTVIPTWVVIRKEKIEKLWSDIKKNS